MFRRVAAMGALLSLAACPGQGSQRDAGGPDGCVPTCGTRQCGGNGCGGSCGTCAAGSTCDDPSGACVSDAGAAVPDTGLPHPADASVSDASSAASYDAGPIEIDGGHVIILGNWEQYVAFTETLVDAMCNCDVSSGSMDSAQLPACRATRSLERLDPSTRESIHNDTRLYDANAASQCLYWLSNHPCDFSQCAAVVVPNVGPGGRCFNGADCLNGLGCVGPPCAQLCEDHLGLQLPGDACDAFGNVCDETLGACNWATGICVAYIPQGQACRGPGVPAGAFCDGRFSFCDDVGDCHPLLNAGTACESPESSRCVHNAYCKQIWGPDAGFTGMCAARPALQEPCDPTNDRCRDGLACDPTTRMCLKERPGKGDRCSATTACLSSWCQGASGTTPGLCTAPALAQGNQHCATGQPIDSVCDKGLYCDPASSLCKALFAPGGGPCTKSSECEVLLSCVSGSCLAQALPGESCASVECAAGDYVCDAATGLCLPPQPDGRPCRLAWDCAQGTCDRFACTPLCVAE